LTLHHYMFDIPVRDRKVLFNLRDKLVENGCTERFTGDLGLNYVLIHTCSDRGYVILSFSDNIYIDLVSKNDDVKWFIDILTSVIPRNKVLTHYVLREV